MLQISVYLRKIVKIYRYDKNIILSNEFNMELKHENMN